MIISRYAQVDNTAAPGVKIQGNLDGSPIIITDIIAYNTAGAAAMLTFYDQNSNIKAVFSVGAGETAVISLVTGVRYDSGKDIYARTDNASVSKVTISGYSME